MISSKSPVCIALAVLFLFAVRGVADDLLRIYPAPEGEVLAGDYAVTVEGNDVPVYSAKVASADPVLRFKAMDDHANTEKYSDTASFVSFDFEGRVEVAVVCSGPVREAKILPASSGIVPVIEGNRVRFTLIRAANLTLETNGTWVHALHIFANPPEKDVPRAGDPNVIFYGPGIHEVDCVKVASGKTVYVAGGAVVRGVPKEGVPQGALFLLQGDRIHFRGRGIVDGSLCPAGSRQMLSVSGKNISLEGVVLRDSSEWTVAVRRSEDVCIRNLKIFGSRYHSDGIDICNSRDVEVADCFVRTLDDLIVIKTDKNQGEARHIAVHGCVLWNEVAHALSLGAELREKVGDVRFSDCDIIHDLGREWALRIYQCDGARIGRVVFENIRIGGSRRLMSLWIGKAMWSLGPERGHIDDVTFRDIRATGEQPLIEFQGYDAAHTVNGVTCDHVTLNAQPLRAELIKSNDFVKNVRINP